MVERCGGVGGVASLPLAANGNDVEMSSNGLRYN